MKPILKTIVIAAIIGLVITGLTCFIPIGGSHPIGGGQAPYIDILFNKDSAINISHYSPGQADPICSLTIKSIHPINYGIPGDSVKLYLCVVNCPIDQCSHYVRIYRANQNVFNATEEYYILANGDDTFISSGNAGFPFPYMYGSSISTFKVVFFLMDFVIYFAASILILFLINRVREKAKPIGKKTKYEE